MTSDTLSTRLRAAFLGELEEQIRVMNADLLVLEREPSNADRLKSLFRVAHTLKGAARAANVPLVEQACHAMESLLARAREGTVTLYGAAFATMFATADALADARDRLARGEDLVDAPIAVVARDFTQLRTPSARGRPAQVTGPSRPAPAPVVSKAAPAHAGESRERLDAAAQIRIDAGALDAVLEAAADLRQAKARVTARAGHAREIDELAGDVMARWRGAARQLRGTLAGSGPAANEMMDDVDARLRALVRETGQAASALERDTRTLAHTVDAVAGGVVRLRMRPFSEICEVLPRMVRDLAAEEKKSAQLVLSGAEVEADRGVLDALREPIVHLVRNAVSHGVEHPGRRTAAGKPAQGSITLSAAVRGQRFVVTVSDNGAGVDTPALRQALAHAGRAVPPDEAGLARALFDGGVSTRGEASIISGRGVGLDLVRTAVERIGGTAHAEWFRGGGTTFTLDCPLTLASIRVVLVILGKHTVAIPTASVERLLRVRAAGVVRAEGRDVLPGPDGPVPIVSLAHVLGPPYPERGASDVIPAVQLLAGGRRLAVAVDGFLDECEVTVRPLEIRQRLLLVNGVAMITGGGVAPVLNAAALVDDGLRAAGVGIASLRTAPGAAPARHRVLVVDDSITTRTLEQSVLEAAGYEVFTAVDGADAWRLLQERPADLVVSDVEMPRMDGVALCRALRASPRFARLPVILVTALESAEQRASGLEAGADAYLGKSSFDQQTLLDVVRRSLE